MINVVISNSNKKHRLVYHRKLMDFVTQATHITVHIFMFHTEVIVIVIVHWRKTLTAQPNTLNNLFCVTI